jgi:hypothetical protein
MCHEAPESARTRWSELVDVPSVPAGSIHSGREVSRSPILPVVWPLVSDGSWSDTSGPPPIRTLPGELDESGRGRTPEGRLNCATLTLKHYFL